MRTVSFKSKLIFSTLIAVTGIAGTGTWWYNDLQQRQAAEENKRWDDTIARRKLEQQKIEDEIAKNRAKTAKPSPPERTYLQIFQAEATVIKLSGWEFSHGKISPELRDKIFRTGLIKDAVGPTDSEGNVSEYDEYYLVGHELVSSLFSDLKVPKDYSVYITSSSGTSQVSAQELSYKLLAYDDGTINITHALLPNGPAPSGSYIGFGVENPFKDEFRIVTDYKVIDEKPTPNEIKLFQDWGAPVAEKPANSDAKPLQFIEVAGQQLVLVEKDYSKTDNASSGKFRLYSRKNGESLYLDEYQTWQKSDDDLRKVHMMDFIKGYKLIIRTRYYENDRGCEFLRLLDDDGNWTSHEIPCDPSWGC